jgi:hypothetical protein
VAALDRQVRGNRGWFVRRLSVCTGVIELVPCKLSLLLLLLLLGCVLGQLLVMVHVLPWLMATLTDCCPGWCADPWCDLLLRPLVCS